MLKVWFPGTNDTEDYGLGGTQWINDNVVITDNGKLGKCLSFNGSNSRLSTTNFELSNNWSFACWVKDDLSVTNWRLLIMLNTTGSDADTQMSLWLHTGEKRFEVCANGKYVSTVKYVPGQWNHFAATYDGSQILVYLNGAKVYTLSDTNEQLVRHNLTIGARGTNANGGHEGATSYFYGLVNDLRIWDNQVVSPREIKELSKGLVLHYPLAMPGQENLLSRYVAPGAGSPTSTATGGRTTWLGDYKITIPATENADTYFNLFTSEQLTMNATYTISCQVSGLKNGSQYNFPLYSQNNPNMGILKLDHNGLCYLTFTMTYDTQTAAIGANGETVYRCFMDDCSPRNIASGQGPITLSNFKLEKGSIPTPWVPNKLDALYTKMGFTDNIEYDVSGYGNNGIQNNTPIFSSDTCKYTTSIHFDGVNQTVMLPNLATLIPDSIFTFNIWFKRLESEPSSKAWETILGGQSGFEIESCSSNSVHDAKIKAYSWGGGLFAFNFDKWNMLTMVQNGSNALFYLNGELKLTGTFKTLVSGNYFIGSWRDTTSQNYRGYMSDARIYSTALSADDILELYHTPISLSNNGTLLTQGEYVES